MNISSDSVVGAVDTVIAVIHDTPPRATASSRTLSRPRLRSSPDTQPAPQGL
ncbi:MAG TPA: hypothetical protein VE338_03260 [Ktedonobacterales bacterium]|nr:hypothetical protein [Ktedonobacterales bacterium]